MNGDGWRKNFHHATLGHYPLRVRGLSAAGGGERLNIFSSGGSQFRASRVFSWGVVRHREIGEMAGSLGRDQEVRCSGAKAPRAGLKPRAGHWIQRQTESHTKLTSPARKRYRNQ